MSKHRYYEENGYVIFEELIPEAEIDALLAALEDFKARRMPYYSQSIHQWIRPEIDSQGFMRESMQNFTELFFNRGLRKLGFDILLGERINAALKEIHPRRENFVMWQNMLFDRSTGTIDHYDAYYLDTFPGGYLNGAWVSLEDIGEGAGPFRIYPGSHKHFADTQFDDLPQDEFRLECAKYAEENAPVHALLKKGDVMFWHASTMHGSADQSDVRYSRKSLTAHYYPHGFAHKRADVELPGSTFKGKIKDKVAPIFRKKVRRHGTYPVLLLGSDLERSRAHFRGLRNLAMNALTRSRRAALDMRRSSYES